MAVIAPFRGILYVPERINNFSQVVAPPYDAITPQQQEALYQRHPYNIVRLILGQEWPSDNEHDNRYRRAATDYAHWQNTGILQRDAVPALYAYEQVYELEEGQAVRRLGFLAAARLEDFSSGAVLPHERTLAGPKIDRLRLLEACQANFCPIFGLYSEPEGQIQATLAASTQSPALITFTDTDGIGHRLWRMTDAEPVQQICRAMADRVLYIADGHHRYETALAYRDACRRQGNGSGNEAYQSILMYIASMEAPGITILPFHRILSGLNDFHAEQFLALLADRYQLEAWPAANRREALPEFLAQLRRRGQDSHTFGLGLPREDRFFICSISRSQAAAIAGKLAPVVKQLDVTVLHELILRDLLRVRTDSLKQQRHVSYIPSARKALAALDQEPAQVGFWLNPTRIEEVKAVAQERETMPQKSTYFYPKPITGLVINPLHVPETIQPLGTNPGLIDMVGGEAKP